MMRASKGFTALELLVAMSLLATVGMLTIMTLRSAFMAVDSTAVQADLESKCAAIMDTMAKELKDGGTKYASFTVASGQQSITFARCNGYTAGKPTFGNQITYSAATYDSSLCLERTEIINGEAKKQILTNLLNTTTTTVTSLKGVNVSVVGINFQLVSSDIVCITMVLQKSDRPLKENVVLPDDTISVTAQAYVQMLNN